LPVYNGEKYLGIAISSILRQKFEDFELIVVNDGSRDSSLSIANYYAKIDNRVRIIDQVNQGLVKALNNGIEAALGKYIARMDADDISAPWRFEEQIKVFRENPECDVVGASYAILDKRESVWRIKKVKVMPRNDSDVLIWLLRTVPIAHPTALIKKSILLKIGSYKDVAAEDYDLWSRLFNGRNIRNIRRVSLLYRLHENSISNGKRRVMLSEQMRISNRFIYEKSSLFFKTNMDVSSSDFSFNRSISFHFILLISSIFYGGRLSSLKVEFKIFSMLNILIFPFALLFETARFPLLYCMAIRQRG
jgi:glycosyltransferase involved in cell wall biosynthesis